MITSRFSVVTNILKVDDDFQSYIADPEDFFTVTFNGTEIHTIGGYSPEYLYGRLIMCWGEGIHTLYTILTPNNIIQIDEDDHLLSKYLIEHYDMVRGLEDIELVKAFSLL